MSKKDEKSRMDRSKALESEIEWLVRDRDDVKERLAELEASLMRKAIELESLGCDFQSENGLPCRMGSGGGRARVVEVIVGVACCEQHAQIRKYSFGPSLPVAVA